MITSRNNSLLRLARSVRDGKDQSLIFIEGLRLCEEAFQSKLKIQAVIYSEQIAQKDRAASLLHQLKSVCDQFGEVSESLLATVSYTKTPQGMILLAERPASGKDRLEVKRPRAHLLVILDGINNPVNVGAILRTAEAAGASGAVVTGDSSDPFSPKSLRGAMGSAFRLPIWHGVAYEEALVWCAEHEVRTLCADLSATVHHTEIDWTVPSVLVLGPESTGLSPAQVGMANEAVKIPMEGEVESLNVAAAAAIILYEAKRQRSS